MGCVASGQTSVRPHCTEEETEAETCGKTELSGTVGRGNFRALPIIRLSCSLAGSPRSQRASKPPDYFTRLPEGGGVGLGLGQWEGAPSPPRPSPSHSTRPAVSPEPLLGGFDRPRAPAWVPTALVGAGVEVSVSRVEDAAQAHPWETDG